MNPLRSDYRAARDLPAPTYRWLSILGPVAAACLQLGWFIATIALPIPATDDAIYPEIRELAVKAQIDPDAENRFPELVEALREFDELRPDTVDGENAAWILPEDRTPAEHEAVAQLRADLMVLEHSGIIDRIEELFTHSNLANTFESAKRADGTFIPSLHWTGEEIGQLRSFVALQFTRIKLARQDGDLQEAAAILRTTSHAARCMSRQPMSVQYLLGYAFVSFGTEDIAEIAVNLDIDRETISTLREANTVLHDLGVISTAIEGERLVMIDMHNVLHDRYGTPIGSRLAYQASDRDRPDTSTIGSFRSLGQNALARLAAPRDLSIGVTNVLFRFFSDAHTTTDPQERQRLFDHWVNTIEDLPVRFVTIAILMPALEQTHRVTTRIDASIQATSTILAMAEYRLDTGDWPESLDHLVPDYLDAIPINPVTGDPFEYDHTPGKAPTLEHFCVLGM